jgi:hypothetical protein
LDTPRRRIGSPLGPIRRHFLMLCAVFFIYSADISSKCRRTVGRLSEPARIFDHIFDPILEIEIFSLNWFFIPF